MEEKINMVKHYFKNARKIARGLLVQNPFLHQRLWESRTFGAKPGVDEKAA